MRFKGFLLMTGLALLLGPAVGLGQLPGQGGGFGGRSGPGAGGFGATFAMSAEDVWDQMTGGKAVWKRSQLTEPNELQRFDRTAQRLGITTGEITKDQYVRAMRDAVERLRTGNAAPGAAPAAGAGPRWEYRVHTRERIAELGNSDFAAGLNKLGDEGWELVAAPTTRTIQSGRGFETTQGEFYFKRQKGPARREGAAAREEPAAGHEAQIRILMLKHAQAPDLARTLQQVFAQAGNLPALVAEPRTNALIVRGSQKEIEGVEELALRLDLPGANEAAPSRKS